MNEEIRDVSRPRPPRALTEYNPFYLLSAMCMLAGIFALNDSLDWSPLPSANLLGLIVILNLYEILLILIAVFLARRGVVRDAATLLVLEAFFLADAGFLNAEAFTQDFTLGLIVNCALLALAFVKLVIIFKGLALRLTDTRFALILSQLLILMALPGILKQVSEANNGGLPPLSIYAVWWIIGIIPILYLLWLRHSPAHYRGTINALVALPLISILAHLCTSNWVYNVRWQSANLSPLMLGLAVAIGASDYHVRHLSARMRTQLLLPMLAILVSLLHSYRLEFPLGGVPMTPLRLTLLAAAGVYFHGLLVHRHAYFAMAGSMCLMTAGIGHSPGAMVENTVSRGDRLLEWIWKLVPRTLTQWGIISVIASFILLALGLLLSLLKLPVRTVVKADAAEDVTVN